MAKSPFPGMDPYLERQWRDVHGSLITYTRDVLNDQLKLPLRARSEERIFVETEDDFIQERKPDVYVVEHSIAEDAVAPMASPAATLVAEVEPIFIRIGDESTVERYLEIVDAESGEKVITVVEFISPTNKRRGEGRDIYLSKRREYWAAGANLVEIDLTRTGSRSGLIPARRIPRSRRETTYFVSIRRCSRPQEVQYFPIPLPARLPSVPIPLRPTDRDAQIDLQSLVDRAWKNGPGDTLDYSRPLDPPLTGPEAEFAERMLKAAGKR